MANKRSSSSRSYEIESEKTKKTKNMMRDEGEGGGGINSLPDSILHHVFSFLNIKQVIRISLVSKRWRYLWTCTPSLNFFIHGNHHRFTEFVDSVLILRDSRCNIQRFSITTDDSRSFTPSPPPPPPPSHRRGRHHHHQYHPHHYSDSDSDSNSNSDSDAYSDDRSFDDLNSSYTTTTYTEKNLTSRLDVWILNAIRHNVEEINLEIYFEKISNNLPNFIFTCQSLKKLKLKLISLDRDPHTLYLPDSISLPRLQTLHLDNFLLHFEGDDKIDNFLSNCCDVLESLILSDCGIHRTNLNIVAPNLKHLVIKETYSSELERGGGIKGSVRLFAPNLISFDCEDYLLKNYYLENVSSLVEVYIRMGVGSKVEKEAGVREKGRNAMIYGDKIDFRMLHNVKHLRLSSWAFQIFIATYGLLDTGSTEFDNLRILKLNTWLSKDCIRGITCLLNMSPNIAKLTLNITEDTITPIFPRWDKIKNPADIRDYWKHPLQCMVLHHLKIVEIRGLEGRINELKFLEVLLKNAVVLEELVLTFLFDSPRHDRERLREYSKILQLFPRASSSVTIVFI